MATPRPRKVNRVTPLLIQQNFKNLADCVKDARRYLQSPNVIHAHVEDAIEEVDAEA